MKPRCSWMIGLIVFILLFVTACGGDSGSTAVGGSGSSSGSSGSDSGSSSSGSSTGSGTGTTSSGKAAQAADPYSPVKNTLTINIAQRLPPGNDTLPAGQTVENNVMTQFYEKALNIKLNRSWSAVQGDPYDQKVTLAIASREIPDAMQVNEDQLRLLVKAGLIEDLTDTFNKYASPMVKKLQIDMAGRKALDDATFNGKLYAIPSIALKGDAVTVLWIRKDWLDKLHLPAPKTLDDVAKTAQAFINAKLGGPNTIGMTGPNTPDLANDLGNRNHGFDAIFAAYHSYPGNWVKDANGNVVYGSIQPQTKQALAELRDWYSKGLIDKQFFLRKNPDELFLSGQDGMFFGPWWMGWGNIANSFQNNPGAKWEALAAPVDSSGNLNTHLQPISRDFLVVRKGFAHPEALMKGINLEVGLSRHATDIPQNLVDEWNNKVKPANISSTLDLFRVNMDDYNAVSTRRHEILNAVAGKIDPSTMDADAQDAYKYAKKYMTDPTVDQYYPQAIKDGLTMMQLGGFQAYVVGGAPLDQKYNEVSSLLYTPTKTMKTRWANLKKLEDQTFLQIVIGQAPLSSFDTFVKEWKSQGGDTITKEVADTIKSK